MVVIAQAKGQSAPAVSNQSVDPQQRLQRLQAAMDRTESELLTSERKLQELKQEMLELSRDIAAQKQSPDAGQPNAAVSAGRQATQSPGVSSSKGDADSRGQEQASMEASQIATLDQSKVESQSKYPVRITGTVLLNGFVNSGGVEQPAAPTLALGGRGNTGLALTQTVVGLDADGPRLWGAASRADVRVDFFGGTGTSNYTGPAGLLRLRTAHATLDWGRTQLFFSRDRPLLNPNLPESLVAVAQPELAWSGNLWSWNPQLGVTHTIGSRTRFRFQAAFIDPGDPPGAGVQSSPATLAEASRYPGTEARIAVLGSSDEQGAQLGVGGYFSPHYLSSNTGGTARFHFDAWAATLDYRLPLSHHVLLTGSFYRGQSLGGLGGGGYADYVYRTTPAGLDVRGLEAVGGWAQLHHSVTQRISWNVGFGMDNAFSREVREYAGAATVNPYGGIARNSTIFTNVMYSPTASLLFSVEYRNLHTAPALLPLWISNTTGVAAAYRF